jgi:GldM C-terminal domain.
MSKPLLLLAFILIGLQAFSQQAFYKVKTSPSNTLYLEFNNPIELQDSILRNSNKTLALKSSNGKVVLRSGMYFMLPAHTGEAVLKIMEVKGKDSLLMGEQNFRVKPVYMPVMALSGHVLDSVISKGEIMKEQHFKVMIPECDYAVRFALTTCKIKFPNGHSYDVSQGVIGLSIKKEVSHLKPGARICFENIRILEFTGKERTLENTCYTLAE